MWLTHVLLTVFKWFPWRVTINLQRPKSNPKTEGLFCAANHLGLDNLVIFILEFGCSAGFAYNMETLFSTKRIQSLMIHWSGTTSRLISNPLNYSVVYSNMCTFRVSLITFHEHNCFFKYVSCSPDVGSWLFSWGSTLVYVSDLLQWMLLLYLFVFNTSGMNCLQLIPVESIWFFH